MLGQPPATSDNAYVPTWAVRGTSDDQSVALMPVMLSAVLG